MLNTGTLSQMWDMMRQRHGIAMRAIERLPEDKLDSHPIPMMRTPKELVVHWYGMAIMGLVDGAMRGKFEELDEKVAAATIRTRAELIKYVRECWNSADQTVQELTDEKLSASVETPWGSPLRGSRCLEAANDESIHHRGQFFVYLRALGQEPPDMYDFAHNAPEFQPRARAPQA